ncbi:MAG: histidine phosphatase family protein, partial [Aeromonas veronii]
GAMLRGVYADLDYEATWSQELPQDAFYKLQDGHITRIAC